MSSGERGEIVKRPTSGLIVSGISNWPVAISREETGSTTGSLPSTIPPSPPLSLFLSVFLFRCPLASSIPAASYLLSLPRLHRVVLSSFLQLGERSRSTFFALATSLYVAFQCLRGELYCDCEDRRTSAKQAGKHFCPVRCLTLDRGWSEVNQPTSSGLARESKKQVTRW